MQKFLAHNVYGMNEYGAAVTAVLPVNEPKYVYLASEVEAMRANFDAAAKLHAQIVVDKDARIAQLELALHQIKNSCVDDDDKANELFRLSPAELRKIANSVLMER